MPPMVRIVKFLTSPFRLVRDFLYQMPDDTPLSETVGSALGSREGLAGLWEGLAEHLQALRGHLFRSVVALSLTTVICFSVSEDLMRMLALPVGDPAAAADVGMQGGIIGWWQKAQAQGADGLDRLQVIEPTEAVGVFMRVSLLAGVILALPWITLELFLFVAPGFMPRSRIVLMLGIPLVTVFFLLGAAFCFLVMLPTAIPFLYTFLGFKAAWRPSAYFELVTTLMFWIGVTFEMPLVAYLLAAARLITARQLASVWRFAVVIIAVVAAAITPTVDPVNMGLVMAPMALLYVISILAAMVARRDPKKKPRSG
ncbi:MAG: twin-arginine translocase subunit TatC [Anaerolineales bacterium]|nr:twin-arginine translocase subunit TatC [Anaerolineales bacterium]